jgi:hypothetical protein
MKWQPLFSRRKPQAGTYQKLDTMFERALSAREFARLHGWPLPQPERFMGPLLIEKRTGPSLRRAGQ